MPQSAISRLAYELWEQEGRPHGRERHHWQEAEKILAERAKEAKPDTKTKQDRAVASQPGADAGKAGLTPTVAKTPRGAAPAKAAGKAEPAKAKSEPAKAKPAKAAATPAKAAAKPSRAAAAPAKTRTRGDSGKPA